MTAFALSMVDVLEGEAARARDLACRHAGAPIIGSSGRDRDAEGERDRRLADRARTAEARAAELRDDCAQLGAESLARKWLTWLLATQRGLAVGLYTPGIPLGRADDIKRGRRVPGELAARDIAIADLHAAVRQWAPKGEPDAAPTDGVRWQIARALEPLARGRTLTPYGREHDRTFAKFAGRGEPKLADLAALVDQLASALDVRDVAHRRGWASALTWALLDVIGHELDERTVERIVRR